MTRTATRPPVRQDGPVGRFYSIDGDEEPYVSVTHALSCIAKPALINWAANQERALVMDAAADLYLDLVKAQPMGRPTFLATLQGRLSKQKAHQKELAKAGEIGTQVHALIEWNLRRELGQKVGPEPRVVDNAQWAFMAYQDWAQSVSLKPLFIEQVVFSRTHKYAGTMDLLAEVHGAVTLVDFKTGKAVYAEAHLQNVAYQAALVEMQHTTPAGGLIVRLPKVDTDPAFEAVPVAPVAELFPFFLSVLNVWKWWHAGEVAYQAKRKAQAEVA
jgi:PD-(D/E)XK nuclease superfamily protein